MFSAGAYNINACGVNATVTENICQLGDVFLNTIECSGKEFSQIVRKNLAGFYVCCFTKFLHVRPDVASVQRVTVASNKNGA